MSHRYILMMVVGYVEYFGRYCIWLGRYPNKNWVLKGLLVCEAFYLFIIGNSGYWKLSNGFTIVARNRNEVGNPQQT